MIFGLIMKVLTDAADILDSHKSLMRKHNIQKVLDLLNVYCIIKYLHNSKLS